MLSKREEHISMYNLGFKQGMLDLSVEEVAKIKKVKPKKKFVKLSELYTAQPQVRSSEVYKLMQKDYPYKTKSKLSIFRSEARLPQVIKYNDKLYIVDGNHRLAASKLKGLTEAEVLIYEILIQN